MTRFKCVAGNGSGSADPDSFEEKNHLKNSHLNPHNMTWGEGRGWSEPTVASHPLFRGFYSSRVIMSVMIIGSSIIMSIIVDVIISSPLQKTWGGISHKKRGKKWRVMNTIKSHGGKKRSSIRWRIGSPDPLIIPHLTWITNWKMTSRKKYHPVTSGWHFFLSRISFCRILWVSRGFSSQSKFILNIQTQLV